MAGPQIGVDYGDGDFTTFLATGVDVTNAYPIQAERVLDTRSATSRANDVVNGSSGPRFDSLGRLGAGKFIDVAVASTEGLDLAGVFLNVTAFRPTGGGYVEVYTPGPRRALPSITFQRQVTATNSIFVAPSTSAPTSAADTYYTVRVYTSRPTHVHDRRARRDHRLYGRAGDLRPAAARPPAAPPGQAAGQADHGDSGAARSQAGRPTQSRRRRYAANIASVPCRCGHS